MILAACLGLPPVKAAEGDTTPVARASNEVLEEVVSTARRREEPLQDTPVASTVIGGESLDLQFVADLKTMEFPAPNVNIATVSAFSNAVSISIRGISNSDIDSTVDPPVATFVDGVYIPRPVASSLDLFDVEQIEILRGPQGTLFGRNTSAGAIQVRTRRPSGEFETRGRVTVGEYGRQDIRAAVDIPLLQDTLNAKVAILSQNLDGYYESTITGQDLGKEDIFAVRPMVVFTPSDSVELTVIGEYHRNKSDPRPQQNQSGTNRLLCSLQRFCGFPLGDGREFDVATSDVGYVDAEIWGLTADLEIEVSPGVISWISNYRDTDENVVYDPDAQDYPMFQVDRKQPHKQWSSELRFQSTAWEQLDFVGGVYIFHQEYELERNTTLAIVNPNVKTRQLSFTGQDHDAWSVFGEVNYHVTDRLTLTAGGRYGKEKKDFFQLPFGIFPNTGARIDVDESWSDFGPKLGVQFALTDEMMIYASYQKGFKSGGFNGRCGQTATCLRPFDPEEVNGYEAGFKGDFLDRRLRTNLAVFWSDYADLQRGAIVPLPPGSANPQETVTDNAAGADMRGVELELTAIPVTGLQLQFSVGYLDSEYQDFCADVNGAALFPSPPTSNCGGSVTQTSGTPGGAGAYLVDEDLSSFELARAPKWNYMVNATWDLPLPNGDNLVINGRYTWVDDLFTDVSEQSPRKSTEMLDVSIGYHDEEGRWSVSVFGKNLTDEIYLDSATLVPPLFDTRTVNPPRRYGIELSWTL